MSKQPTHPDEMTDAGDDVIPRPPSMTAHADLARKKVLSSGIVFRTAPEMADWLNAYSGGKFVAIVVENKVVVGGPNQHPDTVLEEYYGLEDKTPYIVPLPVKSATEMPATSPAPPKLPAARVPTEPTPEGAEEGEKGRESPPQTVMPGAPPKFRPATSVTAALPPEPAGE